MTDPFVMKAIASKPRQKFRTAGQGGKERLTVRFDEDMVQWFRSQGRGYQTKMNAALRSFYEAHRYEGCSQALRNNGQLVPRRGLESPHPTDTCT